MALVPLRLGELAPPGFAARRSGFRWIKGDGELCRAGEPVAYCNVGLMANGKPKALEEPFANEDFDVQIAFAPRIGGRLRHGAGTSYGGHLDRLELFQYWIPDFAIGAIEPEPGLGDARAGPAEELELLIATGRRQSEVADIRAGLLSGWHDRVRMWRAREDERMGTLISYGVCDQTGVIRGDSNTFFEFFAGFEGAAHVMLTGDMPIVPCARALVEQIDRTDTERRAIAADVSRWFADNADKTAAEDWVFVGAALNGLGRSPLEERYDILTRTTLRRDGPADAVLLSLHSEIHGRLRHKTLGYLFPVHGWRRDRQSEGLRAWMRQAFELERPDLDAITQDYRQLFMRLDTTTRTVLVMNAMSSWGDEDLQSYDLIEGPLDATIASVVAKDRNLMLQDLAREFDIAVVDLDAIAADLGGQRNLPDSVHASGALQAELRAEVLRLLRVRGVPGFA
jgi:hypothetical protein